MKKLYILLLLLILFSNTLIYGFERDFGMSLSIGQIKGIGEKNQYTLDIATDSYFLSESLRMIFGTTFIFPQNSSIPMIGLQYLGLEQNFNFLDQLIQLGICYNKSYIKEKGMGLASNKAFTFYIGSKHELWPLLDLIIQLGVISQPFIVDQNKITVANDCFFIRSGLEYYF